MEGTIMNLKGTNGTIVLYDNKVEIQRKGVFANANGKMGDRTYYLSDLVTVEYKKPSMFSNGYMKFVISGTKDIDARTTLTGTTTIDSIKDPNTVILRAFKKTVPAESEKLYSMIMKKIDEAKKSSGTIVSQGSSADEILKFKELLDAGIITKDEFEAKKKQLLGI